MKHVEPFVVSLCTRLSLHHSSTHVAGHRHGWHGVLKSSPSQGCQLSLWSQKPSHLNNKCFLCFLFWIVVFPSDVEVFHIPRFIFPSSSALKEPTPIEHNSVGFLRLHDLSRFVGWSKGSGAQRGEVRRVTRWMQQVPQNLWQRKHIALIPTSFFCSLSCVAPPVDFLLNFNITSPHETSMVVGSATLVLISSLKKFRVYSIRNPTSCILV